jgi:hypothetical protein
MRILELTAVGSHYQHQWPDYQQDFASWLEYRVVTDAGHKTYRLAFGQQSVYGRTRRHVVVLDGGFSVAEFNGADDFEATGELLSELKVRSGNSVVLCRYPDDPIPRRYAGLPIVGLRTRIDGAHQAWAVVVNIADHETICYLAGLRSVERE